MSAPRPDLHALSDPARRRWVQGGLGAVAALLAPLGAGAAPAASRIGFQAVPPSRADRIVVPEGYVAEVIYAWGDPVGVPGAMPAWKPDASHSAAEQALQAGMHHDGMAYFPIDAQRGLLAVNHEYTDERLLHADGTAAWSAEKVRKSQAAHGVSIVELARGRDGSWRVVRPSRHARRITAATPMRLAGPAAGHPLLRTAFDPTGTRVLGTFNNCASGRTPWGTYLTCEENFAQYFRGPERPDAHQRRWGLDAGGWGAGWALHDERFDAGRHPNEFNRFGWVVEIDPFDPASEPVKRSALGRAAHEGAWVVQAADGRAVVYMGEDGAFEHLYKFVTRDAVQPGGAAANRELLDHGRLYVARFGADGRGEWLELSAGRPGLEAFASQGELLVKTRQAADTAGGTPMDRPEWVAGDPATGFVYCALTNNAARGRPGAPGADAANPRAPNPMGHILRWREDGGFAGTRFAWEHFVLAGDAANERAESRGNVRGDAFGSPDGLMVDARGLLWIQTDVSDAKIGRGDYARLGHNQMLCADPATGEVRRFLTGPAGCEITGAVMAPDARTLFVNVQHPGEGTASSWPDGPGTRPRSATVAIRRRDGGLVGA